MAIEYNVSENGQRIYTVPKGALDIKETIDHFVRLKNDKKIKRGAIEIVYFKYVTDFNISYSEGERITKGYQEPIATQMIEATIFVCETALAYGIVRMLQTLHEITNPNHKVMVVRSEIELENAIKSIQNINPPDH